MNYTIGEYYSNSTVPWLYAINYEDANWVITSSFMIFTMQTGFGMLESGCVSIKNEVNIMMKNVVDIVLGGLTYWMFGYALSFGRSELNNGFIALGDFFVDPSLKDPLKGAMYAAFLFQLSFATTATTIVSGAMAERCDFKAYCIFSFLNTAIYCIPAGWMWGEHGFLRKLGAVDIAGSGAVHLIGGSAAFASAVMLGPRLGRYDNGITPLPLGNPVNAVMGLFVLWWGWLAFNSGSTYGLSGEKWEYAARAAVMTMISTFGGGTVSIFYTMIKLKGKIDTIDIINGILGSLVSVTAGCFLYCGWEALVVGIVGALLVCSSMPLFDMIGVDDPVGASSVHGVAGIWGKTVNSFNYLKPFKNEYFINKKRSLTSKELEDIALHINEYKDDSDFEEPYQDSGSEYEPENSSSESDLEVPARKRKKNSPIHNSELPSTSSIEKFAEVEIPNIINLESEVVPELDVEPQPEVELGHETEAETKQLGEPPIDTRGKHTNRPHKMSQQTRKLLLQFFGSLKGRKAHYSLKDSNRVYLPEDMNVGVSRAVSAFRTVLDTKQIDGLNTVGVNPEHHKHVDAVKTLARMKRYRLSRILKDITKNRNFGINVAKKLIPKRNYRDRQNPRHMVATMTATISQEENGLKSQMAWVN
ncbi:unnamed protein product [Psylliodes chrysocephalus]|uniref:Ammonium transporter AmtB-like domain-containing protein n=1 Tax=Psylliodes chrysocephalus TaxID=3402493 RepID=A0A9P0D7X2_9CUCU|nr:unnamed protein product [Psylliodes chrysocephala]